MFNRVLIAGIIIVNFALVCYTAGIVLQLRTGKATKVLLALFTAGIGFDIISTSLMIAGSGKIPITIHGFIGYSALAVMLVDVIILWRRRLKNGSPVKMPAGFQVFSFCAWLFWIISYAAGALMAAVK